MKKLSVVFLSGMLVLPFFTLTAQENPDQKPEKQNVPRREHRAWGGPGRNSGQMHAPMMENRGRMMMGSARVKAEDEIKAKFPQEYAALEQERKALEDKFQALAEKAGVKLPQTLEAQERKMKEFQEKHKKELQEIFELFRTDPKAASEKLRALYKAEGIEVPTFMNRDFQRAPEKNRNARVRKPDFSGLEKAYPEEYKKVQELQRKNPKEGRKALLELYRKYEAAQKESAQKQD